VSSSGLRVLFLSPLTKLGGEELSVLSLARGLMSRGHEVELATEGGDFLEEFIAAGLEVHLMAMNARRPGGIVATSRPLRRLLETRGFDVIHSQEVFPTIIAELARRFPGRLPGALIYHYRGVRPRMMPLVTRVLPPVVEHIVTNAEANRQAFLHRGVSPDKVRTIYNGVAFDEFDRATEDPALRAELGVGPLDPVAGVVGRLHPVKGHRPFLEAARIVLDAVPRAWFLLVGDGPLRGELEAAAHELGIQDRVRFLGFRRDVPQLIKAMDLLVLPSIEEAIGRVLVEAHASGRPAVASRVGGTSEVVEDGVTGYLVPPGDVSALAARMIDVLASPDRGRAMGAAGDARVRPIFGLDAMIDSTLEVYDRVAPRR